MDTMKQWMAVAWKYKYVVIVAFCGLALMLLPQSEASAAPSTQQPSSVERTMAEELEEILSRIQGVGKVQLLLTEARGQCTIYVQDESVSQDSTKTDAVIITDGSRAQTGLVSQVIPPVYQGAIVVCQGGADPVVKLAVVEAVSDATGLSADKITVLKMK